MAEDQGAYLSLMSLCSHWASVLHVWKIAVALILYQCTGYSVHQEADNTVSYTWEISSLLWLYCWQMLQM